MALVASNLETAPTSLSAADPAPFNPEYKSDFRSVSSPAKQYNNRIHNYNLHLQQVRYFGYHHKPAHAREHAVRVEHEQSLAKYTNDFQWRSPEEKRHRKAAKQLERLQADDLKYTDREKGRMFFKATQKLSVTAPSYARGPARDSNRKMNHKGQRLLINMQGDLDEALEGDVPPLGDGGADGDEVQLHDGYWGDVVDGAVEKFTKKTGKMVAKDWNDLGISEDEAKNGFWSEIGEEEWERIVMEEAMMFSEAGSSFGSVGEGLGSDWDWALVRSEEEV